MLVKTRGIVLHYLRYKESSIIARIYTEQLGLQSYIVNGVRSKSQTTRIALFQPFTLLNLVAYNSRKGGLNRLSDYSCAQHFSTIPYDIRKTSVLIFLTEVLAKGIQEEEENPAMFQFLYQSIVRFDEMASGYESFHLRFLLQLSHYLGFGATEGIEITSQVAADNQRMQVPVLLTHPPDAYAAYFDYFIKSESGEPALNGRLRNELLTLLLRYYRLHIEKLGEIKSLGVLSEVLS